MNGAALKVALGGLGLPPTWFAEKMGVTMRTVVRWFDGGDVSAEVAAEIDRLQELALQEMIDIVNEWNEKPGVVELKTFRTDKQTEGWPATWWRQITFRVREHFEAQGRSVTVVYE